MMSSLLLLLMGLAAYRVTRLVTDDQILDKPRVWLHETLERREWRLLDELVGCPWCVGVYVSILTVAATSLFVSVPLPWLQIGAVSALVGLLSGRPEHG